MLYTSCRYEGVPQDTYTLEYECSTVCTYYGRIIVHTSPAAAPPTAIVPWSRCFKVVSGQGSPHQSGKVAQRQVPVPVCALSLNYLGLDLILPDSLSTNPSLVPFYIKHGRPAKSQRCRATPPRDRAPRRSSSHGILSSSYSWPCHAMPFHGSCLLSLLLRYLYCMVYCMVSVV